MNEDRLRRELEALERAAPADLPPRPAVRTPRGWLRLVAPALTVALAMLLVTVVPRWFAPPAPILSPSGSATASLSTASPATTAALTWHVRTFDDPGAVLVNIANIGGRLIMTGSLEGFAQAWTSVDGGASWRRAVTGPLGDLPIERQPGSMGTVAGSSDLLVSLGGARSGSGEVTPALWLSDDWGTTWRFVPSPSVPRGIDAVVWDGSRFLGFVDRFTDGAVDYVSNSLEVWVSLDGIDWQQAAGPDPFGVSVALLDVSAVDGLTVVSLAEEGTTAALWWSTDGTTWHRSGADGLSNVPASLGADGADVVAAVVGTGVTFLRTADGETWTSRPVEIEAAGASTPVFISNVVAGRAGILIIGTEDIRFSWTAPLSWLVPPTIDRAESLDIAITDAVADGDGFVGIHTCGPVADCATALVFGMPEDVAPPHPTITGEAPSPSSNPSPSSSASPFDDDPALVTGKLSGAPELAALCTWLTDDAGQRWEIIWPDGYEDAFRNGEAVVLRDGEVVARAGDVITVTGTTSTLYGTFCMVGIPYEAESVLSIEPHA